MIDILDEFPRKATCKRSHYAINVSASLVREHFLHLRQKNLALESEATVIIFVSSAMGILSVLEPTYAYVNLAHSDLLAVCCLHCTKRPRRRPA